MDQAAQITGVKINSETTEVLDISNGGLLVKCGSRLPMRSAVLLTIVGVERSLRVSVRVVRCQVADISAESVIYQVALAFERPLSLVDNEREIGDSRTAMALVAAAARVIDRVNAVELEPAFALNNW